MKEQKLFYQPSLDGVRGLAILLVIMAHSQLIRFGWIGVQLFFVLSGYLITEILLKEKIKTLPLKTKFKNFWMRRVLRIFPLYYLYLFVLFLIWIFFDQTRSFPQQLPYLLTYTYNYSLMTGNWLSNFPTTHLWSLSVEEQFYLLYPFILLLCSQRQLRVIAILLIIFSVCFRFFLGEQLVQSGYSASKTGSIIYNVTFSHFDAFLLGGCIAIFRLDKIPLAVKHFLFLFSFFLFLIWGLFLYLRIFEGNFEFNNYVTHLGFAPDNLVMQNHVWSYLILNIFFAALIVLLLSPQKKSISVWVDKIFSIGPLVAIGKISYGMYIIHSGIQFIVLSLLLKVGELPNKYIIFAIFLPVLYVAAKIIYEVFEKRFLLLKEKFR